MNGSEDSADKYPVDDLKYHLTSVKAELKGEAKMWGDLCIV